LAFNKSIVEELRKKVGDLSNVEVSTLHSLGAQSCRKAIGSKINASKYNSYIGQRIEDKTLQGEIYDKLSAVQKIVWKKNIRQLVDLGRVNLITDAAGLRGLAEKFDLDIIDNEIERALEIIEWGKKNIKEMDFTDMIYFPNVLSVPMRKFDWVFIDECQDLNAAQREMFLKCVKPNGGRWIAVGDERQAIYGFSGADADSFAKLKNIPHTVKLPLSICYRCDQNIIMLAKTIVPQIEWRDGAPVGEIDRDAKKADVKDGDMILCRITAPLVKLCMEYISTGVKAYVKGRDIGANLINMIENTECVTIDGALEAMRKELGRIIGKLIALHICQTEQEAMEHPKYVSYNDKVQAIEFISRGLEKSEDVANRIRGIFADEKEGICLSTIHKSKGLENDRVFIICEDKMPLKGCMDIPWMAIQEWNLIYVAITRAKHYLGYIQDFY
jgi:DNA helicase-2/ATP-dependent DNA helicase PcrA